MIIDADAHIDEFDDLWTSYSSARDKEHAFTVNHDHRGFSWLTFRDRQLFIMDKFVPYEFDRAGRTRTLWREGADLEADLRRDTSPTDYSDAAARVAHMDEWGIDRTVLYPNFGFMWEASIHEELDAVRVNCAAWNRWAADLTKAHNGRILPVGHLSVQGSTDWIEGQLKLLSEAGVRMAMFSPGLINGLRPSHPDNDRLWSLFVKYGVSPAWHIDTRSTAIFANHTAWYDNDQDSMVKLVPFMFNPIATHMALTDLAVNGVFHRYPELRIVVAEVGAPWFPELMERADGLWEIVKLTHGRPLTDIPKLPSEYLRDHTIVTCSFTTDATPELLNQLPGNFAFATDYPHPEGIAGGIEEYKKVVGPLSDHHSDLFYGGNIGTVLTA